MKNRIRRFNENIDPYGEEIWDDDMSIFKIGERDIDELGYIMAHTSAEAKQKALERGWFEAENRRYVYAEEIKKGPYKELFGKAYDEQYEIELERAQAKYDRAKNVLDSLQYCIEKIKNK